MAMHADSKDVPCMRNWGRRDHIFFSMALTIFIQKNYLGHSKF